MYWNNIFYGMIMIKIQHISKQYDKHFVLSDINLTFQTGELIALVGENGAGKSTLMRIICGYIPPTEGQVFIWKNNINQNRIKALKHIGYVPEISCLYGEMVVYDFLMWVANIWQIETPHDAISFVAEKMQIIDVLTEKIETLSKGYKKRVEIASAILHKPDFLILDEPTDGLDPNQKHYIRTFIKQYAKEHIVLLSTHVLEDTSTADRIIMLSHGKIINDSDINTFKKTAKSNDVGEAFRALYNQLNEAKK